MAQDVAAIEVIAPNFKRRLSGVTSTIIQLVPMQRKLGLGIVTYGEGLPAALPRLGYLKTLSLWRKPAGRPYRIWHARRNVEMIGGMFLRDILRMPIKIVFTSASQRHHKSFTKFLIGRMDAVIATSAKTGAYLEVPHSVILHGIDTARFRPADDRAAAKREVGLNPDLLYAGCFGRIRRQKGTDQFLEAMFEVLKRHSNWGAVIAGRATAEHLGFQKQLEAKATESGVGNRIFFVGEHTDIDRWYRALDLFVAPQRWEGFGLTPLEAMATGLPVVAADVGAFRELVSNGQSGVIVPPDDLSLMTEAIDAYASDAQLREAHGRVGLAIAQRDFPLEREARQIVGVYETLWSQA